MYEIVMRGGISVENPPRIIKYVLNYVYKSQRSLQTHYSRIIKWVRNNVLKKYDKELF